MRIILLGLFIYMSGCAGAPTIAPDGTAVPANTTTIKAISSQSSLMQFKRLKQLAVNSGFTITSQDLDTQSFTTDFRNYKNLGIKMGISVVQQGNQSVARISGKYKMTAFEMDQPRVIKHTGQSGSPARNAWIFLYKFSLASQSSSYNFE